MVNFSNKMSERIVFLAIIFSDVSEENTQKTELETVPKRFPRRRLVDKRRCRNAPSLNAGGDRGRKDVYFSPTASIGRVRG